MISKPMHIGSLLLLLFALLSCGKRVEPSVEAESLRFVSLSPAITDILFDVGVGESLVGVSSYCILPEGQKRKVVGNMMTANTESLLAIRPTHLFFQGSPVRFQNLVRLDPTIRLEAFRMETISDILKVVRRIGEIADQPVLAEDAISDFSGKIAAAVKKVEGLEKKRAAFILDMGSHGIMAAGPGTFIDELIRKTGGINVGRDLPGRQLWRKTDVESLLAVKPEVLICQIDPSERDGRKRVTKKWSRYYGQPQLGLKRVEIVTDRRWTFPSTRVADLAEPMTKILHPERF
jgi:iron complex transport system substrate-binding protein